MNTPVVLECVVNVSEGRDAPAIAALADSAGPDLLDVNTDADHNRSVFTLVGESAPRRLAATAVDLLDITLHLGVHPRIGVVDVVPFVALGHTPPSEALRARDEFCTWAGLELDVPCFRYGPERTLPQIRAKAFADLHPDCGPAVPHATAGAIAVGARDVLVAYNVWLDKAHVDDAKRIARHVRGPAVRALGLQVGDAVQVSMNLIDPTNVGPGAVVDLIASQHSIASCELVGLIPQWVLDAEDPARWDELGLSAGATIEARLQPG